MAHQDRGDPYKLHRFVDAQEFVYARARAELSAGQKRGHWIWFIFPQFKGLGMSPMSQEFGIDSLDEAKAYLNHPIIEAFCSNPAVVSTDCQIWEVEDSLSALTRGPLQNIGANEQELVLAGGR